MRDGFGEPPTVADLQVTIGAATAEEPFKANVRAAGEAMLDGGLGAESGLAFAVATALMAEGGPLVERLRQEIRREIRAEMLTAIDRLQRRNREGGG